jgi:hypothetical protein
MYKKENSYESVGCRFLKGDFTGKESSVLAGSSNPIQKRYNSLNKEKAVN